MFASEGVLGKGRWVPGIVGIRDMYFDTDSLVENSFAS